MSMTDARRREIEQDCAKLVTAYSVCIDHRRFDRLIGLFAEDAVLSLDGYRLEGRARIDAYMRERPKSRTTRHVISNMLIDVLDADSAEGLSYLTGYRFDAHDDSERKRLPFEGPFVVGSYSDRFVRTAEGWRFAERLVTPTFMRPHYFDIWAETWK